MNIEREQTGPLTATLKLKLTPEDYSPGVETQLKEQRKNAVFPGFRPGQAPMPLIKKRVGKAVLVNEVERLIGQGIQQHIEGNKLRVLGQPLPKRDSMSANNFDEPGEFNFAYEMGMAPSIDVDLSGQLNVTMPMVEVDDATLDKEITDMRRRFGKVEDAEVSEANDMVIGDMIELNADGSTKEGGIMNRTTISLEFLKNDTARALLTGKAVGAEVVIDPHTVSDGHDDLARMLGVDHDRVHHLEGNFLFRVESIKRMAPAALDNTFFDRVFGQGAVADEPAFRAKVKEGLESAFARDSDRVFTKLVMKALYDRTNMELPDSFLKRWILETSEQPTNAEEVEANYNSYAEGMKRQLLQDRIVEKYGLEAKGEELNAFAQRYVSDQFMQYGMPAPEGEELQKMAGRLLGDREQIKRMRDSIVERKLITHFKAMLSPKTERMSLDAFITLARTA
ncbi:MAG: trigger factor [Flavobacteriales bacterium]|nr:trigger factor [Flavobacteriales bacterium]